MLALVVNTKTQSIDEFDSNKAPVFSRLHARQFLLGRSVCSDLHDYYAALPARNLSLFLNQYALYILPINTRVLAKFSIRFLLSC